MLPLIAVVVFASLQIPGSVLLPAARQQSTPCPEPSPAELEALAVAYIDAFNTGDMEALDALLAPDYIQEAALGRDQDRELHKERVQLTRTGFPDLVYTIDDMMVDGDLVLIRHTMRGTHDGEYAGLTPTGTRVEVSGIHINRVECGQIAQSWNEGDGLGLYQQLGLVPEIDVSIPSVSASASPVAASPVACPAMTEADGQALATRWWDELWSGGATGVLDEILYEGHVHHWASGPDTGGREAVAHQVEAFRAAMPDLSVEIELSMSEGDLIAERWILSGTFEGPFLGAEPTGERIEVTGINIFRVSCGQIVEAWAERDTLNLYRQIGLAPPPSTPAV